MSGCFFLKGARVEVRVKEPLDRASGRPRDRRQKLKARAMVAPLEQDQMLARTAPHAGNEFVVAELDGLAVDDGFAASLPNTRSNQAKVCLSPVPFEVCHTHA